MEVHGGHGARRRFLERDGEPHVRAGRPASGGVWRKEIERGVVRQPDREALVPDEDRELGRAGRITIAAHVLLQLAERDLRREHDAFAWNLELQTALVELQPHDPARVVAVERHRELVGHHQRPPAVGARRVQRRFQLRRDVEHEPAVPLGDREDLVREGREVGDVAAQIGLEIADIARRGRQLAEQVLRHELRGDRWQRRHACS